MASDQAFVEYVCDQLSAGRVTSRKMFGEYALYYDQKVVALICDNQLFVKPTAAGRAVVGAVAEAPPYKGAKPHLLIDEQLDDYELLLRLFAATAHELPAPKPKKPRAKRTPR